MSAPPVVLVTGGGRGIGRCVAERLAADGYRVVVTGRSPEDLGLVATAVGGLAISGDTASADDVRVAIDGTIDAYGRLDAIVLNAGIAHSGSVTEQTLDSWERVMRTNLTGTFLVARAALPHLIETRGSIVAVSSAAALTAGPHSAAYCTSKAAINMLIKTIAVDYGPLGVRANAVCPAWVRTAMADHEMDVLGTGRGTDREGGYRIATARNPLRRAASPEEVAATIAWLCSDAASYINGAIIPVDGGAGAVNLGLLEFGAVQ